MGPEFRRWAFPTRARGGWWRRLWPPPPPEPPATSAAADTTAATRVTDAARGAASARRAAPAARPRARRDSVIVRLLTLERQQPYDHDVRARLDRKSVV